MRLPCPAVFLAPALAGLLSGCAAVALPALEDEPAPAPAQAAPAAEEEHGVGHALLLWLPNRVFDLQDVVRARLRLGPGWAISVRATELLDTTMGAYETVFIGIHGPRGEPEIPWPVGLEGLAGLEGSIFDFTGEEELGGPRYGPLEIGAGLHVLLLGADLGVEPWEAIDFLAGIFFLDPNGDDY